MRRLVALVAVLVIAAGCSSEAGTPKPVRAGCALFDQKAVAAALKTTAKVDVSDSKTMCSITVGGGPAAATTPDVAAMVFMAPDSDRGYSFWHGAVEKTGGVRDVVAAAGGKAFVAPAPRPHESMAGVVHDGTFYRISVFAMQGDPVAAANAFVDVLEDAL